MNDARLRGLYIITAPARIPEPQLTRQVEHAIRGGARLVQFRDKTNDEGRKLRQARALAALCRSYAVVLIVNDDPELALECQADGIHIGSEDCPLQQARARLGSKAIIGVSCYNRLDLALAAQAGGADYVAFGSFFPSSTKPEAVRADLQLLAHAREQLHLPICAIGGITAVNAGALVEAGADMLAVVSAVFRADDVERAARQFSPFFV